MKLFAFSLIGSLSLFAGQASAQFVLTQVSRVADGTLSMTAPDDNDISGRVDALARSIGAPIQKSASISAKFNGLGSVGVLDGFASANSSVSALLSSGIHSMGNPGVTMNTSALGNVISRLWAAQRWGTVGLTRQYQVVLPPGADFGVMVVESQVTILAINSMSGGGSASGQNITNGGGSGVSLQPIGGSYSAGGGNVGFLVPVTPGFGGAIPFNTVTNHPVDITGITSATHNVSQAITGYVLVYPGDIVTIETTSAIEGRNTVTQPSGNIEGDMETQSHIDVKIMSYDFQGITNLETFPKMSSLGV